MDLLKSIRKEGSRGGVDFKWDDVKNSQHRLNYLGHSLMAPVGRWQKGKDLNWYAKAEDAEKTAEEVHAEEEQRRKDELRKVKEAEEDAMARALGLPVPDRSANTEPLGESKIGPREVNAALKDTLDDGEEQNGVIAKRSKVEDRPRERHKRERRSSRDPGWRHRSYSRDRKRHEDRYHSGSRERHRYRSDSQEQRRNRPGRYENRHRSRSREHQRHRSDSREPRRHRSESRQRQRHRSNSEEHQRRRSRSRDHQYHHKAAHRAHDDRKYERRRIRERSVSPYKARDRKR